MLLLLSLPAQAAGYYFADAGIRSLGRGSAFVAGVDDLSAQYYNPAGLYRVEKNSFKLDVAAVQQQVVFQRTPDDAIGTEWADVPDDYFKEVNNGAKPYIIPSFGVAHRFNDRLVVALGFYPPYAPDVSYPGGCAEEMGLTPPEGYKGGCGPQRYTLVDTVIIQATAGPSASFQLNDWVALGAGVSWNLMYAEQELFLTSSGKEDPGGDIGVSIEAMDKVAWSGNAGVIVEHPSKKWAVGAAVQAPINFAATGSITADFTTNGFCTSGTIPEGKCVPTDEDITLAINMPWIVRGGVLVRPVENLEIELAAVWQNWSVVEEVLIDELDLEIETTILGTQTIDDPVSIPANFQDAASVRLGGEYGLKGGHAVRAGGLWESSAVPAATQGVGLVDGNKAGYSLGGSFAVNERITVDAAFAQTFIAERTITDSEVDQIWVDVLSAEVKDGKIVGNGSFSSRLTMGGIGLAVNWGAPEGAPPPAEPAPAPASGPTAPEPAPI